MALKLSRNKEIEITHLERTIIGISHYSLCSKESHLMRANKTNFYREAVAAAVSFCGRMIMVEP
jgi:hypothetical protein